MGHTILFYFLCHIELHCHSKFARLLCIALAFMHCPGLQAGDKKEHNNRGFSPTAVNGLKPGEIKNYLCPALRSRAIQKYRTKILLLITLTKTR